MSTLVIHLPSRERLRAATDAASARVPAEYGYLVSPDGLSVSRQGRCAPALLPKADTVVAVVADTDVGWQRLAIPKAPGGRLRAALAGVLEEHLLDDTEAMHFALAPGAVGGETAWVATVHRSWLTSQLAALEQSGVVVDRVVPQSWPDEPPSGHFWRADDADPGMPPTLTWADGQGVTHVRLSGGLARAMLPQWALQPARWTADPSAAAPAERWLGSPVRVLTADERALQATRTLWNLRQFDLARRHRGLLALRDAWRLALGPEWRAVRAGVVALAVLQLLGLNLWAWHQRSEVSERKQAMVDLLRSAHPQVRAVLDAPVQMQRETAVLRAAAGRVGASDLEALLHAAAMAWPEGQAPAAGLQFEAGRLTLVAPGWAEPQVESFRQRLRADGWGLEVADGRLTVLRGDRAAAPAPGPAAAGGRS